MPVTAPPPPVAETVVVYAPRLAPLAGEAAFDMTRVAPEVLKVSPRLDQALEQTPGLSLFRRTSSLAANPTTQGVSLRAIGPSGASRALVTLDGAPVNDPFGGWVIWSALPPEGLAGAEIVRGAGAGPYGAGALTGVVKLQERPTGEGLGALDLSGAQRTSFRGAVSAGGPDVLVTASGETTDGYMPVHPDQAGLADKPVDLHDASFAFRAQHAIGEAEGSVRLGTYEERRGAGLAGARSIASGMSATATLAKAPAEGAGGWRLQAWVLGSQLLNSSVSVSADRNTTTPANDEYDTPAWGYGVNAAWQGRAGGLSWELGADGRLNRGIEFERFSYQNGHFTRGREAGGQTEVGGVYLDAAFEQGPWLLTAGGRVDAWTSKNAVLREWNLFTNAITLNQHSPDASGTTPTGRAGVRYSLTKDLWVRAAAYEGFRIPTLNELYRPFRVGNNITEANPDLQPERLTGAEAGLGGSAPFDWSTTVFFNRLADAVANVTIGKGPGVFPPAGFVPAGGLLMQRQNIDAIRAWGLEGEASGEVLAALGWRAAFAYTHARVDGGTSAPQLTGKRPAQAPDLTVTGGFEWRPLTRLSLSTDLRYESVRYDDDQNTLRLAPGVTLNMRAGWDIRGGTQVYLALENIGGANLQVQRTANNIVSYDEPATVRIGVSYRR